MIGLEGQIASAIKDCEQGGRENPQFIEKAHAIYNLYATNTCPLKDAEHPYLLGILFAAFAKYYIRNVNIYASIMENACFCFSKVVKESDSPTERQCAAMRLLLFIDDNYPLMLQVAKNLRNSYSQELYGQPAMMVNIMAQGMDQNAYEEDLLRNIGSYCIGMQNSGNVHSSISAREMQRFKNLCSTERYNLNFPLVEIPASRVFELFYDFMYRIICTPCERRITQLSYRNCM